MFHCYKVSQLPYNTAGLKAKMCTLLDSVSLILLNCKIVCKIDFPRPLAIKAVRYCGSAQAAELPRLAAL